MYCHWWTYATSNADDTDSNTEGEYGGGRNQNCWLKNSFAGNETQVNRQFIMLALHMHMHAPYGDVLVSAEQP